MMALMFVPNLITGRSQKKKQDERTQMLNSLRPGDEIVTIGGFYGKIDSVGNDFYMIKFNKGDAVAKIMKDAVRQAVNEIPASRIAENSEELDDDIYAPVDENKEKNRR
jgi:preprotein translocase subunit YajC